MRVFVCVGLAVIIGLALAALWAERCTTCCNGEPCNPALRARQTEEPS